MNAIIMNKRIAANIFDDEGFRGELILALNELIDEELSKQDSEISFELIDIYSEALNQIYNGEDIDKIFLKLQTVEEMNDFINSDKRFTLLKRAAKITLAACAVLAVTLTANSVAEKTTGYNFLEKMAQAVKTVFTGNIVNAIDVDETYPTETKTPAKTEEVTEPSTEAKSTETTTEAKEHTPPAVVTAEQISQSASQPPQSTKAPNVTAQVPSTTAQSPQIKPQNPNLSEVLSPETPPTESTTETTTREPFTRADEDVTAAPVVIKLVGAFGSGFKRNYTVGEEADFTGLTVTAVYDNGTEKNIPISECKIYGFSTDTPANRIVTVEYEGCSFSYLIRVEEA